MAEGWIKIHRKFSEWEWRDKPEMVSLFLHLIMEANTEDKMWHGIKIKRGQLVTSLSLLSGTLGISIKKIRLCLSRLKETAEVAIKTTNKFSIVTICNYDIYQCNNKDEGTLSDTQKANKGQAEGKQRATTKEYKNIYTTSSTSTAPARTHEEDEKEKVLLEILEAYKHDFSLSYSQLRIEENQYFKLGLQVLTEWELRGWQPQKIEPGKEDFQAHKFSRWLIQQKDIEERESRNENYKTDRFQRRRGSEPVAKDREAFDGTF